MLPILLCAAFCASPAVAHAQVVVPAGDGAWVVLVETSGGIAGQGAGRFVVTSAGRLDCPPGAACANALAPDRLQNLTTMITAAAPQTWAISPALCSDCFRVRMRLMRRQAGAIQEFRAEWDEPLAPSKDARALYQQVMKLATPQVRPAIEPTP